MKAKPYPKYKASGIEWLGEVPEHWEVNRLKVVSAYWVSNVDKVPADGELPVRLCNYTDVYYQDFIRPNDELMETTATADEIRRFGLKVGDVVITKDSEDWSDIAVPALVVESAPDLVCGYHLAMIRADSTVLYGPFLFRALQARAVNQQFQVASTGVTRYGLPKSAVGEALLLLPSVDEQHAIATYLDRETEKIDTLVEKKRTLIERLKEKRTALISRTVTRGLPPEAAAEAGLDPHPKLKPSGVEWLGEVPEHWEVSKFSREVSIAEGQVDPEIEPYLSMVLLAPNHIQSGTGRLLATESAADQGAISGKYLCKSGEVVYSKIRPALAKAVLAPADCLCSADMYPLIPRGNLTSRYLLFILISSQFTEWSTLESDRVAMPKVNRETLNELRLPVPLVQEQHAIAAYLDRETAKLDAMVDKIETAIERLLEYRTALITAAVTGKIDVRELVESGGQRQGARLGKGLPV